MSTPSQKDTDISLLHTAIIGICTQRITYRHARYMIPWIYVCYTLWYVAGILMLCLYPHIGIHQDTALHLGIIHAGISVGILYTIATQNQYGLIQGLFVSALYVIGATTMTDLIIHGTMAPIFAMIIVYPVEALSIPCLVVSLSIISMQWMQQQWSAYSEHEKTHMLRYIPQHLRHHLYTSMHRQPTIIM